MAISSQLQSVLNGHSRAAHDCNTEKEANELRSKLIAEGRKNVRIAKWRYMRRADGTVVYHYMVRWNSDE